MDAFTLKGASFEGSQGYQEKARQRRDLPVPKGLLPGLAAATVLVTLSGFPGLYPRWLAEQFWGYETLRPVAVSLESVHGHPDQVDVIVTGEGGSGVGQDPRLGTPVAGLLDASVNDPAGTGVVPLDLRLTPGGPLSFLFTPRPRHTVGRWVRVDPASLRGFSIAYPGPGGKPAYLLLPYPLDGLAPAEITRGKATGGGHELKIRVEAPGGRWTPPRVLPEAFFHPEGKPVDTAGAHSLVLTAIRLEEAPGTGRIDATHAPGTALEGPVVFHAKGGMVAFIPFPRDPSSYWREDLRDAEYPLDRLKELVAEWKRDRR